MEGLLSSVCREQPPCEWRDTPRPVLPYLRPPGGPGKPAGGPLHICPSVQQPLSAEGLQSPTLSTPTLTTTCFHVPSLGRSLIFQSKLPP